MDAGIVEAIVAAGKLLPELIKAVAALIEAGHSPEDAEEIVRRDMQSRLAEYERARAEDEAALRAKHGTPPNPFGEDGGAG